MQYSYNAFSQKKPEKQAIENNMEQLQLFEFCAYLQQATSRGMDMQIREIETIEKDGKRERLIKPWFPLSYHRASLFWHDTTISFPLMDGYKRKVLIKSMSFRMDPVEGKADIKQREGNLYLQIRIAIPDTL